MILEYDEMSEEQALRSAIGNLGLIKISVG
jgi:hypothetical protein